MTACVDTNILVRHLTGDPPYQAERATHFFRSSSEGGVRLTDPMAAGLDFAEAYLLACAESTGVGVVVSWERAIDRVGRVDRIEPPILGPGAQT